ncbi:MAG: beta-galactosidase domain 4-containing protein, partial [Promethearchaeota archaeon]
VKKVYQYIKVKPVDLQAGKVEIINKYDFLNLNIFDFSWEIMSDGQIIAKGTLLKLNVESQKSISVNLNIPKIPVEPGTEYFLKVRATTNLDTPLFLPPNHEVAWDQFKLPFYEPPPLIDVSKLPRLVLNENDSDIIIKGKNFTLRFNKSKGSLSSLIYNQKELIRSALIPNFWRAPTDNDIGNAMPYSCEGWRDAGENQKIIKFTTKQINDQTIEINVFSTIPVGDSNYHSRYTVYGSCDIVVENKFTPNNEELPELPRFGMTMILPGEFKNISWYGRGPHETYWDRKTGAAIGVYTGTVWEQYHPYIRPQENGNKTDVRWVTLSNDEGIGLMAVGMPLLSISAHQFLQEDLDFPDNEPHRHTNDIKPRDLVSLNLDYKQMGVGGDNSWGALPHEQYRLPAKEYSYRFRLRPFSSKEKTIKKLSRLHF